MKCKFTILVVCLAAFFTACKKENNSAIVGKWQETKVRIYTMNFSGTMVDDTTYTGATFTNLDFINFESNGTCTESSDHIYFAAEAGLSKVPYYNLSTETLSYKSSGDNYTLIPPKVVVPPGVIGDQSTGQTITITLSGSNSMLIHTVGTFLNPSTATQVYDAYYVR